MLNSRPFAAALAALAVLFVSLGAQAREVTEEAAGEAPEVQRSLFQTGAWVFRSYGSVSFGDEAGDISQVRTGVERQFKKGLALELTGMAGFYEADALFGEPSDEGAVVGFDVLLRWYVVRRDTWAMHLDAGAGCAWFESEFPVARGTSFNFEPQAGLGFSHRLSPHWWLDWGARWHHVSNGDFLQRDENRGYDAAMPYLGFTRVH